MDPNVSVVLCVRNEEKYIGGCVKSILSQTYNDFEVIIVDDMSSDHTQTIMKEFDDERVKYFRNQEWSGIAISRNRGVKHAKGKYVFFTDGDCMVANSWIEEGLKSLKSRGCVGVEGRIYYVSKDYKPTISDAVIENVDGGQFTTGNVAYKRSVMKAVGGFDERLVRLSDRDIALRIMKYGEICFNAKMIVYHPQVIQTPRGLIETASRVKNRVYLFKRFRDTKCMYWRIVYPINFAKALFPPLILISLVFHKVKNANDLRLMPYTYVYVIKERLQLWETCARERVFLI
jgi:glycosyltransferase involved in cell wall biosynthesis